MHTGPPVFSPLSKKSGVTTQEISGCVMSSEALVKMLILHLGFEPGNCRT